MEKNFQDWNRTDFSLDKPKDLCYNLTKKFCELQERFGYNMKKMWLKTGALILSALLLTSAFISCGSDDQPAETTGVDQESYLYDYENSGDVSITTGKVMEFIKDGASECKIIWSNNLKDGNSIAPAARQLGVFIKSSTGVELEAKSDLILDGSDPASLTEILIGETSREESATVAKTLRVNDYAIQVVNNKLVVLGGCEAKTVEAVNKLIELYFSADRVDFILEGGYRYQFRYDYPVVNLKVGKGDIADYTIVYAEGCKGPATYLQTAILEAMGRELKVVPASMGAQEYEILVGETGRNGSVKADAGAYKVGIVKENTLVFSGDPAAVTLGVQEFVSKYFSTKDVKLDASLSMSGKIPAFTSEMKLLNLNVTLSGYAENAVVNRYPRLYKLISEQTPDVICLQEVSSTTWKSCITEGLGDTPALTDTYGFVGTGRNGQALNHYDAFLEGAYNAILYNKAKYKLEDSGTFWLSETPDVASVGWDGRTFSICTWAKLTEISSGKQVVVMNTRLDEYGRSAPLNGVKLIVEKSSEFGVPVILAGDFQNSAGSKVVGVATGASFENAQSIAETVVNKGGTYHEYGEKTGNTATSHVLVTRGFCGVKSYNLLTDLIDGGYVSAHHAIVTEILY